MPRKILSLARLFCFSPSKAAEASREPENLITSLWINIGTLVIFYILIGLTPPGFPERHITLAPQGSGAWTAMILWQPFLEAAGIVFVMALIRFFSSGTWLVRMALGMGLTAFPWILIGMYTGDKTGPKFPLTLFGAGVLLWTGMLVFLVRKLKWAEWRPLVAFMMGLNAVMLPMCLGFAIGLISMNPKVFMLSQLVGLFWWLGAGIIGLRTLFGLKLQRAIMAILFSFMLQTALGYSLHFLGAPGILKALQFG